MIARDLPGGESPLELARALREEAQAHEENLDPSTALSRIPLSLGLLRRAAQALESLPSAVEELALESAENEESAGSEDPLLGWDKVVSWNLTLNLPDPGLSPNARVSGSKKMRLLKEARGLAWGNAKEKGRLPRFRSAYLQAAFFFPVSRQRDQDNYQAMLKPYLDGLIDAGLLSDDAHIRLLEPLFHLDRENPRMVLTLTGELESQP